MQRLHIQFPQEFSKWHVGCLLLLALRLKGKDSLKWSKGERQISGQHDLIYKMGHESN